MTRIAAIAVLLLCVGCERKAPVPEPDPKPPVKLILRNNSLYDENGYKWETQTYLSEKDGLFHKEWVKVRVDAGTLAEADYSSNPQPHGDPLVKQQPLEAYPITSGAPDNPAESGGCEKVPAPAKEDGSEDSDE